MRTFSEMSIPDLEITKHGYELVLDYTFCNLDALDHEGALESDIKKEADKYCRIKELLEAIKVEILNQTQHE